MEQGSSPRKIIQISSFSTDVYNVIVALCDDGSLWYMRTDDVSWKLLPNVPDGDFS